MAIRRTWFRKESDGKYFRNRQLLWDDMKRFPNEVLPWRRCRLSREYEIMWRKGVIEADSIGKHDRWIPYDDSDAATDTWIKRFLASDGRIK